MNPKLQNTLFSVGIAASILLLIGVVLSKIKVTPFALYKNPEAGFQMQYPAYWERVDNPEGAFVVLVAPRQSEMDVLQENVNITAVPIPARLQTLDQASKEIIKQLTGTFKSHIKMLSGKNVKMGGQEGYEIIYVGVPLPGQKERPLQFYHAWTLRGGKAYILTYLAKENDFDAYIGEVRKIVRTFEFIEPQESEK